jgi:hypothetical protein
LEGFVDIAAVDKEIVSPGESVGLDVEQDDVKDPIHSNKREDSTKI